MFLSTVTNNLDAKGRVSVPADFRSTISNDSKRSPFDGIVIWPSLDGNFLEGGGISLMEDFQASLDLKEHYDPERSALQYAIFASSRQLAFDGGGRVSLPKDMHEFANLNGKVTFVGLGRRFEIWNPKLFEERRESILTLARESRHILKTSNSGDVR
ncbi:MAG: division/cell wall cluster transcriptional repressor MraZ [Hellea sp.]